MLIPVAIDLISGIRTSEIMMEAYLAHGQN